MKTSAVLALAATVQLCGAADFNGDWIAEVLAKGAEPQYARVALRAESGKLSGTWNQLKVEGSTTGERVSISLVRNGAPVGALTGMNADGALSGEGTMSGGG